MLVYKWLTTFAVILIKKITSPLFLSKGDVFVLDDVFLNCVGSHPCVRPLPRWAGRLWRYDSESSVSATARRNVALVDKRLTAFAVILIKKITSPLFLARVMFLF